MFHFITYSVSFLKKKIMIIGKITFLMKIKDKKLNHLLYKTAFFFKRKENRPFNRKIPMAKIVSDTE